MTTEDLIESLTAKVNGKNDRRDVLLFTLSTCMWCKKCKRWLDEHNIAYRYVDVDKIEFDHKAEILDYLRNRFEGTRISYPFMICDDEHVVGYNPNRYEELMKGREAKA
ncbi:MAG: glutaredoxin family protein [Promethearchaeota archaeon]